MSPLPAAAVYRYCGCTTTSRFVRPRTSSCSSRVTGARWLYVRSTSKTAASTSVPRGTTTAWRQQTVDWWLNVRVLFGYMSCLFLRRTRRNFPVFTDRELRLTRESQRRFKLIHVLCDTSRPMLGIRNGLDSAAVLSSISCIGKSNCVP